MTRKIITWLLFFACTLVAGLSGLWFVGNLNANGWTAPGIAPPGWVFGPVWSILYLMIATSGTMLALAKPHDQKPVALGLWALQMCLNTLWTPVFFGAYDLWGAFWIILALWASIGAYVWVSFRIARNASLLFLPYWAWVSFAAILNFSYILVNPAT